MKDHSFTNGQPAHPYAGTLPSHDLDNVREKVDPQTQAATPYEGTPPETLRYTPTLSSTNPPPYTFDSASTDALPSYAASAASPPSPLLLHVYHPSNTFQTCQVLGPDKSTVLYTVTKHPMTLYSTKPNVTVCKANTSTVIGTATFHFSKTVEMVIHGNPIAFTASNILSTTHSWTSLATTIEGKGMQFTWKMEGLFQVGDMICVDQQGKLYAKFLYSRRALKKEGKFEMGPFVSGVLMDEVVVTGLTMVEAKRWTDAAACGSGALAAAAC